MSSTAVSEQPESGAYERLDPDVRLMLAVRDDRAEAFEELVRRYQSRLIHFARELMGSADQAEDLVQEVFLRLFRSRKNYSPDARFATYIFRITRNVIRNARRTLGRRKEVLPHPQADDTQVRGTMEQLAQEASALMPTRLADRSELGMVVHQALQKISERQRAALLLSKFEGMSYADIGSTLELSTPAVRSLLSRARVSLRLILEPYLAEGRGLGAIPEFPVDGGGRDEEAFDD